MEVLTKDSRSGVRSSLAADEAGHEVVEGIFTGANCAGSEGVRAATQKPGRWSRVEGGRLIVGANESRCRGVYRGSSGSWFV